MARKPYPSDVTDDEWAFVAPYLTLMREEDVDTIVLADTDSPQVAEALARQADAAVAEVPVNSIPDDGTYEDMMRQLVGELVSAISA